jgi:hypothetical protein
MLLIIGGVLVLLWLLGFIGHVGGGLVHILLVVGLIVVIFHFIRGRKVS